MALAPTAFTSLLYSVRTNEERYEKLKQKGYLSATGLENPSQVIQMMNVMEQWSAAYWKREEKKPLREWSIGGSSLYHRMQDDLISNGYINEAGQRLKHMSPRQMQPEEAKRK